MSTGGCPQPWAHPLAPRPMDPTERKVLTHSDVHRPSFLLCHSAHLCHRVRQVRGERPIDVRLQLQRGRHEKREEQGEHTSRGADSLSSLGAVWLLRTKPYRGPGKPTTVLRFKIPPRHSSWDPSGPAMFMFIASL